MKKGTVHLVIVLAGSLIFSPAFLYAQPFFPKGQQIAYTLPELEQAFNHWAKEKDLTKEKGWKYYARWQAEMTQRLNGDGSLPDQKLLFSEAEKVALQKTPAEYKTNGSGWLPAGPYNLPPGSSGWPGLGRINCIAFHPTDPSTLWVGVAQGGLWKSVNNGESWTPLTDNLPILRISDIAVDPTDPNIMYVCVGDYAYLGVALNTDNRKRNTHYGLGVYKTTDGGKTWNPTGLTFKLKELDNSLMRRLFINPTNTSELVAAGIEGIFRSHDAGKTWNKVRSDLIWDFEQDKSKPEVLYASTGYVKNLNRGEAGVLKSLDFGDTWTALTTGIPKKDTVQRTELSISLADPNYVYALTCDVQSGFYACYLTTDGGTTWTEQSNINDGVNILDWYGSSATGGQGTYDLTILADPQQKEKVYVGGIFMWGSADKGNSWKRSYDWALHPDQHFLSFNPLNNYFYMCNDGGIFRTNVMKLDTASNTNFETEWEFIGNGMNITSFYRLGLSENNSGNIIAGAQDNSTFYHNSGEWTNIIGGDGMECILDPNNPNVLYGSSQYGNLERSLDGGLTTESINPDFNGEWTTPFVMERTHPGSLYAGYNDVWHSSDGGSSWKQLSNFDLMPDLFYSAPASALAVAPDAGYIYVAKRIYHSIQQPSTLFMTKDGGLIWQNITAGLPDSLYFTYIAVNDDSPTTAWVTCSGFAEGQKIFKTTDAGNTWKNSSYHLPNIPVNCVVHDRSSSNNTIYAATDIGVYYLNDELTEWQLYSANLPNVIVSELEIHYPTKKLYAATFGRGLWMTDLVDDVSGVNQVHPLKQTEMSLSPSPNNGSFDLKIENIQIKGATFEIVDILGKKVQKEELNFSSTSFAKRYQLNVNPGLYYARLSKDNHSQVVRFRVD